MSKDGARPKLLYLVTEDWYFCSHRLPIARAARDAGFEVLVATRVDRHADAIRSEGFQLFPLKLRRRGMHPWRELAALIEIVKLYRRVRPEIVHHVAMKPVIYGSIAARFSGVSTVVNALAGLGYVFASSSLRARLLRPFVRLALRGLISGRGRHAVVQNPDDRHLMQGIGIPERQLSIIRGSGVDVTAFRPGPEPEGKIVVTMVSRMLWDKGVGELVEAARRLECSGKDIRVQLVGPPDHENPAAIPEWTLREWEQEGIVQWLGQRDDIAELWTASHIAVLPSYREGLPKSLLEAAACGRPMVATDVAGC
ncbi:MAG TPA: glycosyltransferase family 4 protein, partial [Gammaproteobacteria bacterium]|nr:glycosyltransferase family 4 protein [Gammaproteobacteria bacterium]